MASADNQRASRKRHRGVPSAQDRPLHTDTVNAIDLPLFLVLLVLFVGSGCAALVYEIVWFQMLELTIGASSVSIAVLLATYMGGMFLGSLGLARFVPPTRHPLMVYAVIEVGIAVCGLGVLLVLPYAGGLYTAIGGPGAGGLLMRGLLSAICLMPPTILMGATLPAVSRWMERTPRGVSQLGFLYAGNTLGAVTGCLLAGFYLLRVFDTHVATFVAVGINLAIAAMAFGISKMRLYEFKPARKGKKTTTPDLQGMWPVLLAIGLSGMTALSAEVVWTRLLSLQLGATVYTYSLILAAVLLGLGIGSSIGAALTRLTLSPRTLLGVCQALIVVGIAWAAYLLTAVFPFQQSDLALGASIGGTFRHDLFASLSAVLPAALVWGASFPLALAAVSERNVDPGRSVGLVYAANTGGAILGSLGTPLVAMALLGSQRIQQGLITVACISALIVLLARAGTKRDALSPNARYAVAAGALVVAILFGATIRPIPGQLVGYGPGSWAWQPTYGEFIHVAEGMNSSVAISRLADGVLQYHNAGKVQASSTPGDLRLQRMLGHLTTLQQEAPTSVLVIGCGSGVTAGAVCIDPRVESLTIAEIEPLVPQAAQEYFSSVNEGVVSDPKTEVVIDDGRHFLMTSDEKFDAITCDPFDPWTRGAASLSTREFYQAVRDHLNPGGTVTVWVPLYQTRTDTVRSEIATFMEVFPNAVVWDNVNQGAGDVVLSARVDDAPIDVDAVTARVAAPEYARVRASLASIGFPTVRDLFATFGASGPDLVAWTQGAEVNTDRNLRLQYLAGEGHVFAVDDAEAIYAEMTARRTWPDSFLTGSAEEVEALRTAAFGR